MIAAFLGNILHDYNLVEDVDSNIQALSLKNNLQDCWSIVSRFASVVIVVLIGCDVVINGSFCCIGQE